jgi:Bifunctional DNA primase/polymerase, N-terminal/AAA domain
MTDITTPMAECQRFEDGFDEYANADPIDLNDHDPLQEERMNDLTEANWHIIGRWITEYHKPRLVIDNTPKAKLTLSRVLFPPEPHEPIVEHALYCATSNGWPVFPVPPGTKKSHKSAEHSGGRPWGATTSADEIRHDFKRWPNANVGVVCGVVSGIFVVEADTKEGHNVDGIASLAALEAEHGALPATRQAISPSGSVHYYFRHPGFQIKNSASAIAPGVDVRGDGGMVVAPPSVKPGKGVYRWRNDLPIADAPQWLLDRIIAGKEKPEPQLTISQQAAALVRQPRDGFDDIADDVRRRESGGYSRAYLDKALDGERAIVANTSKGNRNEQLNKSSFALGQLVPHGLTEKEVIDAMFDAAMTCGHLRDKGRKQTMDTINSGLRDGIATPRPLPLARILERKPDNDNNIPSDGTGTPRPPTQPAIHATQYTWKDPETIPQRDWLYGRLLLRKFVTATISPGGTGKSSLIAAEALAMVSGKPLLGVPPEKQLKVWLWNLEDPQEETERKIQAAARHYGLTPDDIGDRLLVDSGRDQRLVIATTDTKGRATIVQPVVDDVVAEIIKHEIDVIVIDPFVSCHEVAENDNPAMDMVVKLWGKVADQGNCAVHLVDHTRKMGEVKEVTTESSRGGSAKTDACRVVRAVTRMTKEDATKAGVENHRAYFRTYNDKGNLQPPADGSDWYKLENVNLGNGPMGLPGDEVGVVTKWEWPNLTQGMTGADFDKVAAVIRRGRYKESVQAKNWVGHAIAEALDLDVNDEKDRAKIKAAIKMYLNHGSLVKVERMDPDRREFKMFIEVSDKI